jgi:hypothetical protein
MKIPEGHIEENASGNVRTCVLCREEIDLDTEDAEYNPDWGWMHAGCATDEKGL